jgi:flagellar biogenesis protein FliO
MGMMRDATDGMWGWMAGMTVYGTLVSLLVVAVLVLLAVWLVQQIRRGPGQAG